MPEVAEAPEVQAQPKVELPQAAVENLSSPPPKESRVKSGILSFIRNFKGNPLDALQQVAKESSAEPIIPEQTQGKVSVHEETAPTDPVPDAFQKSLVDSDLNSRSSSPVTTEEPISLQTVESNPPKTEKVTPPSESGEPPVSDTEKILIDENTEQLSTTETEPTTPDTPTPPFEETISRLRLLTETNVNDSTLEAQLYKEGMPPEEIRKTLENLKQQSKEARQRIKEIDLNGTILTRLAELNLRTPQEIEQLNFLLTQATDLSVQAKDAVAAIRQYKTSGEDMLKQFSEQKFGTKKLMSEEAFDVMSVLNENVKMLTKGNLLLGRFTNREEITKLKLESDELLALMGEVGSVNDLRPDYYLDAVPNGAERLADNISSLTARLAIGKIYDYYTDMISREIPSENKVAVSPEMIRKIGDQAINRDLLSKIGKETGDEALSQEQLDEVVDILHTAQGMSRNDAYRQTVVDGRYQSPRGELQVRIDALPRKIGSTLRYICDEHFGMDEYVTKLGEFVNTHSGVIAKKDQLVEAQNTEKQIDAIGNIGYSMLINGMYEKKDSLKRAKEEADKSIGSDENTAYCNNVRFAVVKDFFENPDITSSLAPGEIQEVEEYFVNKSFDGLIRWTGEKPFYYYPNDLLALTTEKTASFQALHAFNGFADGNTGDYYEGLHKYLGSIPQEEYDRIIQRCPASSKAFFDIVKDGPEGNYKRHDYIQKEDGTYEYPTTEFAKQADEAILQIISETIDTGTIEEQKYAIHVLRKIEGDYAQRDRILGKCFDSDNRELNNAAAIELTRIINLSPNAIGVALERYDQLKRNLYEWERQELWSSISQLLGQKEPIIIEHLSQTAQFFNTTPEELNKVLDLVTEVSSHVGNRMSISSELDIQRLVDVVGNPELHKLAVDLTGKDTYISSAADLQNIAKLLPMADQVLREIDEAGLYQADFRYQIVGGIKEDEIPLFPKQLFFDRYHDVFIKKIHESFAANPDQVRKDTNFYLDYMRNRNAYGQEVQLDEVTTQAQEAFLEGLKRVSTIINQQIESREKSLEDKVLLSPDIIGIFARQPEGSLELIELIEKGPFNLESVDDQKVGNLLKTLQHDKNFDFKALVNLIASREAVRANALLTENLSEISAENWQTLLMTYAGIDAEIFPRNVISEENSEKLRELFRSSQAKDFCLNTMRAQWLDFLGKNNPDQMPCSLKIATEFIDMAEGAGTLSQVNSLSALIRTVGDSLSSKPEWFITTTETMGGLLDMEKRFTAERWSNEEKTDFYNTSRDIMIASPGIFADYLNLFKKLNPTQMKEFSRELYPLYRARLVMVEQREKLGWNQESKKTFETSQLIDLKENINNFSLSLDTEDKPFENQKAKLLTEISDLFNKKLGIIKIPEHFTDEHIRSITNVTKYLANLNGRNDQREATLGFYLALMVNDKWNDFREGRDINPSEYLSSDKSYMIESILAQRRQLNPFSPENLGVSSEEASEVVKILQLETQNLVVGNIETIDVKLMNVILNLKGLEDADLYPDQFDKQRMALLVKWGNKKVGSVVARMYQQLANPQKQTQFSDDEQALREEIEKLTREQGFAVTPQALKEHFQDGIRPLATVTNLLSFVGDTNAEREVESLRSHLQPSDETIAVFKRLGEDFQPASGAMALSLDLDYLENLVVKRDDELQPPEKELLTKYIDSIRGQMVVLEGIYGQIKNKFGSLKQGSSSSQNPLMAEKLKEIEKIINTQATSQAITSILTNNMNSIIENIRECLSCKTAGANNDTDLTFGDSNKFYLYSKSETQQLGSITDQIVFVEPIAQEDGSKSVALVMDTLYGIHTPVILRNHIDTLLKKCREIREKFPDARLNVFVADSAIKTGGVSQNILLNELTSQKINARAELVTVDVIKSAFADHYVEFGNDQARVSGTRSASGIIISV